MAKFVFNDDTIKTLRHYSKLLYDVFTQANAQIVEHPQRSFNSDFHLDYVTTPWKFYYYMDCDVQISIHRLSYKQDFFTIESYGFVPELPHCSKISKEFELYNHCYGTFTDIDSVISVWKSIIVRRASDVSLNEYSKVADKVHSNFQNKLESFK